MSGPRWLPTMLLISIFQVITFYQVIFTADGNRRTLILIVFAAFTLLEWLWSVVSTFLLKKNSLALEYIAFFLTGISLVINASVGSFQLIKQFIAVILGFAGFIVLLLILDNVERAESFRKPVAIASIVLLAVTLIFAGNINGAYNWLRLGPISIQTSELVKVSFIFVGASTLEKLQSMKKLAQYAAFAGGCILLLFLMRDLGTALVFFFTFVVLAYMRSGDIRTVLFVVLGSAMLIGLVFLMKSDYILARFATYRHIWDDPTGKGYQQTRVLTYAVSGGFLGLGIGNGYLRDVFAATEDLVFGVLCEELGMLIAFLVANSFVVIFIHSIRCAKGAKSAFYSISSTAAGALLLFQAALNIFGVTDFLPMTGITLPFVSRGGSSTICCWALLAFIKAADNRTLAEERWKGGRT